jgi:uncharacterized membrane protein YuzA (DUF378 family)
MGPEGRPMRLLDFLTLVIILSASVDMGVFGISGFDPLGQLLGTHLRIAYVVVGISALWQLRRQRFF